MAITLLPTPPSRSDPTNFATRADAFLGALPTFAIEANGLASDVNSQQITAVNAANTATAAASTAVSASGATVWVSGTTYSQYAVVISPSTFFSYRRKTSAGSGTVDPSSDTTNWIQISGTGNVSTDSSGNLGIGTSPAVKFHSSGIIASGATGGVDGQYQLRRASDGAVVGALSFNSASSAITLSSGLETIIFQGSSLERMRISPSGNVGVGSSNPNLTSIGRALTVNAASGFSGLELTVGNNLYGAFVAANGETRLTAFGASNPMIFEIAGAERMRIAADGKVGIGTPSSAHTFTVRSTTNPFTAICIQSNTTDGNAGLATLYFGNNTVDSRGYVSYNTQFNTLLFGVNSAEIMRIASDGNISIGSSSAPLTTTNRRVLSVTGVDSALLVISDSSGVSGYVGGSSSSFAIAATGSRELQFEAGGGVRARITSAGLFTYLGKEVGFRGNPVITASADGTDWVNGYFHHIFSGSTFTPRVQTMGNTYVVYNGTGANVTLSNALVSILYAGSNSNVSRTLAPNACVTIYYLNSGSVILSGTGIS